MALEVNGATRTTSTSFTLFANSTTVSGTTAVPLTAQQPCTEVIIQADPGNSVNVYLGNSSAQPLVLSAGASLTLPVVNLNLIYVALHSGTSAQLNWLARN